MDIGIPSEKLFSATFGVSHRFYSPGQGVRDIPLLAVGQDRGRDYRTLIDAIGGTELTLDLVSRPENLQGIDIPANVRAHPPVPLAQYRSLLKRAQIVAVPTHDLAYPTGQSVALEAAASGCAVVVTGTRAMREYFRDGIDAEFVEVGDVEGWRSTLQALREDPTRRDRLGSAARHNVVNKHNADHMWAEIADVLRDRGIVKGSRQTS
ncbi:glycosyl transferase family 1 [Knoellia remsis]|uniref:Glycosyl transferase family 1 n=2 Tax=Knoellia remsis TaxID=407159 RepID=A0A2T0UZ66_9MICO|nr:glycosyl transferase family 1 [Knoellia remsis]